MAGLRSFWRARGVALDNINHLSAGRRFAAHPPDRLARVALGGGYIDNRLGIATPQDTSGTGPPPRGLQVSIWNGL